MRVKLAILVSALSMAAGIVSAQMLAELDAAQAGQAQLNQGSVTGGLNSGMLQQRATDAAAMAPGSPMMPGPAAGFPAPQAAPLPGMMPSAGPMGDPTLGDPGMGGGFAQPGAFGQQAGFGQQPGAPTPTPIPTIEVLTGQRVKCAVCGAMLEDAYKLRVFATDADKYVDDGVMDNGVAGDGIRGNVQTITDKFVGAECAEIRNRLINVVRNAEELRPASKIGEYEDSPYYLEDYESRQRRLEAQHRQRAQEESVMHFFRYHVATMNPLDTSGMPYLLEKEKQRDDYLADWNNRFLSMFRIDPKDPKSEFYQIYVPQPPLPPQYQVPPGYVSPQKLRDGGNQPGGAGMPMEARPNIYSGDPVI